MGGRSGGDCGHGSRGRSNYVCCLYESSCGSRVSQSVVYFQSPNYPLPLNDELGCNLNLKVRPKVCQLRIDFLEFELPASDSTGRCSSRDNFAVYAPQVPLGILGSGARTLCGSNTDSHLYIPVSQGEYVQMLFTLSGAAAVNLDVDKVTSSSTEVIWNLKITQIECDSPDEAMSELEAPTGCKQYIRNSFGILKSFNYDGLSIFGPNQDYTVCFAALGDDERTCGITIRPVNFGLPVDTANAIDSAVATREPDQCEIGQDVAVGDRECCTGAFSSFIGVLFDSAEDGLLRTKFCGTNFGPAQPNGRRGPVQISSRSEPLVIRVKSGNWPTAPRVPINPDHVGFELEYKLNTGMCY